MWGNDSLEIEVYNASPIHQFPKRDEMAKSPSLPISLFSSLNNYL